MTRKVFIPRNYQYPMMEHLLSLKRRSLFAGMGLGKTSSTLAALDAMFLSGEQEGPVLVLAPLRVAQSTWPDEAAKWENLRDIEIRAIVGSVSERKAALKDKNANVFTTNYENLPWLYETLGGRWPFKTVIADESTKLRGFRLRQGAKRAAVLGKIAHTACDQWINLSGTPAPNGLLDLWGPQWFIDGGKALGRSYSAFTQRWFKTDYNGYSLKPLPHADRQIHAALRPTCLSLEAKDYFDLRQPIISNVYVDMPFTARQAYEEMENTFFADVEGNQIEAFNAASRSTKCLQMASGAVYTDEEGNWAETHDVKLQALESILEEAAGMPVLVAYHFGHDLERLKKAFPHARVLDKNPSTLREWNAGKIKLLFAHPASAGHGLNLQDGGNIIVFFTNWWNLEEYQQIIERIGPTRQMQAGHDRPVFIYHIVARGTVEELVIERRESKKTVQDTLMEAMSRRKRIF